MHTARCQPRSRSIRRPAEIRSLRSVGGSASRSETNSTFHRTPGSSADSRSAISGTRLSANSEAGPGAAGRPTTRTGCCDVPGKPAAEVSTVPSSHDALAGDGGQKAANDQGLLRAQAEPPGQRLLGAQRSQLPPAVHLARRPAAASPRSAGSEVHPVRQCAGGWARCLRHPCPGIARMARYVNAARQVPARCPRVASVRGGAGGQAGHESRPGRSRRWPYGPGCSPTEGLGTLRWHGDSRCPPWLRLSPGTAHQAAGARTTLVQPLSRASKCW